MPTHSSSKTLTLAGSSSDIKKITMKHYVDEKLIDEYLLELNVGIGIQSSQSYQLPELNCGKVEVYAEIEYIGDTKVFTKVFRSDYNANDLYKKGLLISTSSDVSTVVDGVSHSDLYVDFLSGKNRVCYCKKAMDSQWILLEKAPRLKKFLREEMGHFGLDDGIWKEKNRWIKLPVT